MLSDFIRDMYEIDTSDRLFKFPLNLKSYIEYKIEYKNNEFEFEKYINLWEEKNHAPLIEDYIHVGDYVGPFTFELIDEDIGDAHLGLVAASPATEKVDWAKEGF